MARDTVRQAGPEDQIIKSSKPIGYQNPCSSLSPEHAA